MVYHVDDFPHQGLQFVDPVQSNGLDLEQAILLALDLIAQVVESSLVEPTHEGPEDATDDRHRDVALDPVLLWRSEGGSTSSIKLGQGSSEVMDGGDEPTDVELHVEPGLNFCFQVSPNRVGPGGRSGRALRC
jgi:hypothetical protein